jgi:hypothetical protein
MRKFLLLIILAGSLGLALEGCAPIPLVVMEDKGKPLHRPVDWEHILLTNRVKDKLFHNGKVVFIAEVGEGEKEEYGLFLADSDGRNVRKLYSGEYIEGVSGYIEKIRELGNGEKILVTTWSTFLFIDTQTWEIVEKVAHDNFSFSPDGKDIVFSLQGFSDELKFYYDLYIMKIGEDLLPKVEKIAIFIPKKGGLGEAIHRDKPLEWTSEGITFETRQSYGSWLGYSYSIVRTYSINPDGTNLKKVDEKTERD